MKILKLAIYCCALIMALPGVAQTGDIGFNDWSTDTVRASDRVHCLFDPRSLNYEPHFAAFCGGIHLGIGPGMGDHGLTYEVGVLNLLGYAYYTAQRAQRLSLGVGFTVRGQKTASGQHLERLANRHAQVVTHPDGRGHSEVNVFSVNFPLMYRHRVYRMVNVYAGPIARWNVGCQVKSEYPADITWSVKGRCPVNLDIMAGIDYLFMGAYIKYTPMSDIKDCPLFKNTLNMGLTVMF